MSVGDPNWSVDEARAEVVWGSPLGLLLCLTPVILAEFNSAVVSEIVIIFMSIAFV